MTLPHHASLRYAPPGPDLDRDRFPSYDQRAMSSSAPAPVATAASLSATRPDAALPPPAQAVFEHALHEHRSRMFQRGNLLRVAATAAFAGAHVVLGYPLNIANYRGNLDLWTLYCALGLVAWLIGRARPSLARYAGFLVVVFDMPMVFVLQMRLGPASNDPTAVANFTAAIYVTLVIWSALALDRRTVALAAVVATLLQITLAAYAPVDIGAHVATTLVMTITTGFLVLTLDTLEKIVTTVAEERVLRETAERVSQERERLIATVSHDFRSPLAVVLSAIQTVQRDADMPPDTRAHFLDSAVRQLRRLLRVVSDLLDLARLRNRDTERQPTDLGRLVRDCVQSLAPFFEAKSVEVRTRVAATGPTVTLDPGLVERAVANLLENASKFAPPASGVSVAIEERGAEVAVRVADEGPGITPEDRARLFTPFFRGQAGLAAGEGTGLGLSIVLEVARAHGGRVEVESEPGAGAAFTLFLPAQRSL